MTHSKILKRFTEPGACVHIRAWWEMNCFESSTKEFRLCPEDVGGDTEEFKVDQ